MRRVITIQQMQCTYVGRFLGVAREYLTNQRGTAPRLLYNHLNEMHLAQDGPRHDERVEVVLPHAPRQFVEHGGQLDP